MLNPLPSVGEQFLWLSKYKVSVVSADHFTEKQIMRTENQGLVRLKDQKLLGARNENPWFNTKSNPIRQPGLDKFAQILSRQNA